MHIYIKDDICMIIYCELSIDSKPKKSTKMSVTYKLHVRMTKEVISIQHTSFVS